MSGASLSAWKPLSLDWVVLPVVISVAYTVSCPIMIFLWPIVVIFQCVGAFQVWRMLGRYVANPKSAMAANGTNKSSSDEGGNASKLERRKTIMERIRDQSSKVNPFLNPTTQISQWERARLSVLSVTLAPIRVLAMIAIVLVAAALSYVIMLGRRPRVKSTPRPTATAAAPATAANAGGNSEEKQPLKSDPNSSASASFSSVPSSPSSAPKRLTPRPLDWVRRLAVRWLICPLIRLMLFTMGFYYVPTTGTPASFDEAPIIVSNHITFLEPLYLVSVFGASPVGEQSNLNAPIIGPIIAALQLIGVDRFSPTSRADVAHTIIQRAREPYGIWPQTLIFPEGTTTAGNALIQFKPGAFLSGMPVQPCVIRYHNERHNPAWVSAGHKVHIILLRMLCEPINWMSCEFLPVHVPWQSEKADPALYARNVRADIAARLDVPVTEHSYEDIALQQEALRANVQADVMELELQKVKSALHMDLPSIKKHLERFKKMDVNADGVLDIDEFERGLGFTEPSPVIRNLFSLLDVDDSGRIDFREFLIGLGILNSQEDQDRDQILQLAFKMFDVQNNGRVQLEVIRRAFRRALPEINEEEEKEAFSDLVKQDANGVDFEAFKAFALKDPRYLKLFRKVMWQSEEASA